MTIYDISLQAGVSIATVSRVLNGSSKVSDATRKKVLAIIEKNAYTPNAHARVLSRNITRTVGILCTDSSDLYLAKGIYYIDRLLRDNNYDSILCCCGYSLEDRINGAKLLISKKVDCIILLGSHFVSMHEEENSYIREAALSCPVMILNADYLAPNVYCYMSDDYAATYAATLELINSGRKHILYIYNSTSYSSSNKYKGYVDAMMAHGLNPAKEFVQHCSEASDEITVIVNGLTSNYERGIFYDAIITSDDHLALGAIKFAKRAGLAIPQDIAIIGYNNSILAVANEPELTSVDNRLEPLCRQMISGLVDILNGKEISRKSVFDGFLVKRDTT